VSLAALERAAYDLGVDAGRRKLFREDPAAFLAGYRLTGHEEAMLRGFDVRGLQAVGLNPMLTMGLWTTSAPDRSIGAYLAALNPTRS